MSKQSISQNQAGAVSLITVIILAIILSIITTGLLRLSIQGARSSIDDDLSNRAFYAAESGINDAVRYVKQYVDGSLTAAQLNGDVCDPAGAAGIGVLSDPDLTGAGVDQYDTEYTCQLITLDPPTFEASANESTGTQVPLSYSGDIPTGLTIYWHKQDTDGAYGGLRTNDQLPPSGSWDSPAMLRVNVFSVPTGASFNRTSLGNDVVFLKPASAPESALVRSNENPEAAGENDGEIIDAECVGSGNALGVDGSGYACKTVLSIPDFAGREYYVRIKSLYRTADFQLSFVTGGTTVFSKSQALIDVTGRATDVYRRLQARVNLAGSSSDLLPDYAIESAGDICKLLTVTNSVTSACP